MNGKMHDFLPGLAAILLSAVVTFAGLYLAARAVDGMSRATPVRLLPSLVRDEALAQPQRPPGPKDWERRHIVALLRGQGLRLALAEEIAERILNRGRAIETAVSAPSRP
jgi:hypothetical protein